MVGTLAKRVFGSHDLPIPRSQHEVVLVGGNIDALRRRLGDPGRRDAAVGARPRARRSMPCSRSPHLREPLTDLVRQHVGGVPARPRRGRRQARSFDPSSDDGDDPIAALQQAFGDPEVLLGAVRVARAARARSRGSTPPSPSSSATPTGSSTPSPCASSAATRCGSPRPSRRQRVETSRRRHVRRAAARHPPRRRPGRPRQGASCRASSTAPATTAWRRCWRARRRSRRRTRSTPPGCGSPASAATDSAGDAVAASPPRSAPSPAIACVGAHARCSAAARAPASSRRATDVISPTDADPEHRGARSPGSTAAIAQPNWNCVSKRANA